MLIANELKLFLPAPGAVFGRLAELLCTAGFLQKRRQYATEDILRICLRLGFGTGFRHIYLCV